MDAISRGNYLPSFKKSIKTEKIGQAKTLLAQISSLPAHEKETVLQSLALAPDKTAFELLSFLTAREYRDPDIYDRLIQLIMDRAHLNFNFALILINHADPPAILHAAPLFRHILSNETDKDFLKTIIRTIGENKIDSLTSDIAEFIFYDDRDLKTEAIKALVKTGSAKAREILEQAANTKKCSQTILDALQVLGTEKTAEEPVSPGSPPPADDYLAELESLVSGDIKNRVDAFSFFLEKGPKAFPTMLSHLETGNHDLTITLLQLISRTLPPQAVNVLFAIVNQKKIDHTIKFAAYNALAAFPNLESAAMGVQGLSDPAMFVRLAAIRVLDKNLSDFVCAEIKNRIESGTKKGEALAETVLDARANHIIEYLMISDTFSYITSNYLARSAPIPVIDTFIAILEKRNLKSTARKYRELRREKTARKRALFIVISSSESILNTYSKLIYSCGFSSLTFQNSQDAFETIVSQKPSAIICDLFLTKITGLDFAREARELYSKRDVPIILSTLQKTMDTSLLQKEMNSAGVNHMCEFPATASQIKSWIKKGCHM